MGEKDGRSANIMKLEDFHGRIGQGSRSGPNSAADLFSRFPGKRGYEFQPLLFHCLGERGKGDLSQ
jgi:hypothetical protein